MKMINRYKYPLRFYILAALIPWSLWLTAGKLSHQQGDDHQMLIGLLGIAGLCAPLGIAALFIFQDKALVKDVFKRFIPVTQDQILYLLLSVLLMPTSILLAMGISVLFGYDIGQFRITGHTTFSSSLFSVWFILIFAPIVEELAWHSYGTDCLRQKFSLFTTSMIFAVYWALWHMPLASIQGYYHANLVKEGAIYSINFVVSLIPFVILMNWLYYKSGRNIMVAVFLHLTANLFNEIFATHPDSKVIQTGLLLLLSIYLFIHDREMFLCKKISSRRIGWSYAAKQADHVGIGQ
jgi:membrane protease YdiL (CAAX protease family)